MSCIPSQVNIALHTSRQKSKGDNTIKPGHSPVFFFSSAARPGAIVKRCKNRIEKEKEGKRKIRRRTRSLITDYRLHIPFPRLRVRLSLHIPRPSDFLPLPQSSPSSLPPSLSPPPPPSAPSNARRPSSRSLPTSSTTRTGFPDAIPPIAARLSQVRPLVSTLRPDWGLTETSLPPAAPPSYPRRPLLLFLSPLVPFACSPTRFLLPPRPCPRPPPFLRLDAIRQAPHLARVRPLPRPPAPQASLEAQAHPVRKPDFL